MVRRTEKRSSMAMRTHRAPRCAIAMASSNAGSSAAKPWAGIGYASCEQPRVYRSYFGSPTEPGPREDLWRTDRAPIIGQLEAGKEFTECR